MDYKFTVKKLFYCFEAASFLNTKFYNVYMKLT